jgi:hypothetical protein
MFIIIALHKLNLIYTYIIIAGKQNMFKYSYGLNYNNFLLINHNYI